jgi:GDP-L-fucose synthase
MSKRIIITGGTGFLGKAVNKILSQNPADISFIHNIHTANCDLTDKTSTIRTFTSIMPTHVIHLAARVGGIGANQEHPGQFFYDNMQMGINVIHTCKLCNVEKLIVVGTVCGYPKFTSRPFKEEDFWNGYPEETNAPYGIAKKSLLVMIQAYAKQYGLRSTYLIPTNLYGPNDNFDDNTSHVIPAIIKKIYQAQQNRADHVRLWGSGLPTRDFLYVDDCANAIFQALHIRTRIEPINIGSAKEISIKDLANKIKAIMGYDGEIVWDLTKPDGQPARCLDIRKAIATLHWGPYTNLDKGLYNTIQWYKDRKHMERLVNVDFC